MIAGGDVAQPPIRVDFASLSRSRLEAMAAAGEEVVECIRVLAKTGDNLVSELLRGHETFYEWSHYPPGDVYDAESHAQFYYHAHPQHERSGEHGHFHTFLRANGIPPSIRPAPIPDYARPVDPNDDLTHLVAISMNSVGLPIRLFATNRWVTGETWYRAEDVCLMVDRFVVDHAQPSWPVNRWIGAMMQLFHPQIVTLLRARDDRIGEWAAARPGVNVYEDRELEIAAALDIDIDAQIAAVRQQLSRS